MAAGAVITTNRQIVIEFRVCIFIFILPFFPSKLGQNLGMPNSLPRELRKVDFRQGRSR